MSGTVCDCGHPEAQHLTLATSNRCAVAVGSVGGKAQVCGCLGFEELSDWERERRAAVPFLTAPSPAAEPCREHGHVYCCVGGHPSPAAEPPEGLREALRRHHPIMRSETGPFSGCRCGQVRLGQDVIAHVVAELHAVLAPLLAQAATDRAAVESCEGVVRRLDACHGMTLDRPGEARAYADAAEWLRRALSGDAR